MGQVAVEAQRADELKEEDGDGCDDEQHHKHHHPNRCAEWLWEDGGEGERVKEKYETPGGGAGDAGSEETDSIKENRDGREIKRGKGDGEKGRKGRQTE